MRISFGVAMVALISAALMPCALGMMSVGPLVGEGYPVYGPSISGVTRTVDGVTKTYEVEPWPEGTLDLVNDPLRTMAWQAWFTGCSNDLQTFNFKAQSVDEINHLIEKLSAVKADHVQLVIKPGQLASKPGQLASKPGQLAGEPDKPDNLNEPYPADVQFSVGNQSIINIWFDGLECDETGARVWGVHRFTEPPKASPPTLTLTVGGEGVELEKLEVPPNVEVVARVSAAYRSAHQGSEMLQAVNQFVAKHAIKEQSPQ